MLTDWARARDIVAGSADFYRVRAEVEQRRLRWAENRRGDLLLPRGLQLAEAESMLSRYGEELDPETRAFVKAREPGPAVSRRSRRVRRRCSRSWPS